MSTNVIDLTDDGEKNAGTKERQNMQGDAVMCEGVQLGKGGPRGTVSLRLASTGTSSAGENTLNFRPDDSAQTSVEIDISTISNMQVWRVLLRICLQNICYV